MKEVVVFYENGHLHRVTGHSKNYFTNTLTSGKSVLKEHSGYVYGFNTQEKVDEISGIGNHNTALYWEYDPRLGRRWNVDPAFKMKPWMSPYHSFSNKPVLNIDPSGASDGDYVNQKGEKIGSDGKDDKNVYVVTGKSDVKTIKKNDSNGGVTDLNEVKSAIKLPSKPVRQQIGSVTQNDTEDNSREYGGIFGLDSEGNEKVVFAKPGPVSDPTKAAASINPFIPNDPNEGGVLKTIDGTFHSHPSKQVVSTTPIDLNGTGTNIGGEIKQVSTFIQVPSAEDIQNAASREEQRLTTGNSYVVGARSKTVSIYNGSGVLVTMPLSAFISVGR